MILPIMPSSCASTSIVALSVSWHVSQTGLQPPVGLGIGAAPGARPRLQVTPWTMTRALMMTLTTSSKTSPAAKLSPSAFFHPVMPPSVMVGDMAGMRRDVACRT